ncbi:hypothetical protein [Streptomyces albipurpureus]|uniref:Uncharacterized protein n=1 Tax=Streptomyces albipurpureus TaxID=2897419 RepID=A0ABT0UHY7_9ACTN|nr:hypothetical protein [Streptomyces sp. CWNU-1]MCM2388035.1 hypothetical protein [Streptomyces sp. CWNU-1]
MTAYLHADGLGAHGGSVSAAGGARPEDPSGVRPEEGSTPSPAAAAGSIGRPGARYSTIRIVPEQPPDVRAEFPRVLAPGGRSLRAFQLGDEPFHQAAGRWSRPSSGASRSASTG